MDENTYIYIVFYNRVGEGRACWSLGNAYVSLGNHKQALHYARKHLDISKEVSLLDKHTVNKKYII